MKKIISILSVFVLFLSGCGASASAPVVSGGSTSVEELAQDMIEDYNAENPDLTPITYDSTGSSDGISKAVDGSYDVGFSSREVKEDEVTENMTNEVIAYDGIAVVVNPENPVKKLTMEQLKQIYTGEITNWSKVGGSDDDIAVVSRDSSSGTRGAFEEIVGFEDKLVTGALEAGSNGDIIANVTDNKNAIGYVSFSTLSDDIAALAIDDAQPTTENVLSKKYPIQRPFVMVYMNDNDNSDATLFIEWIKANSKDYLEEHGLITP